MHIRVCVSQSQTKWSWLLREWWLQYWVEIRIVTLPFLSWVWWSQTNPALNCTHWALPQAQCKPCDDCIMSSCLHKLCGKVQTQWLAECKSVLRLHVSKSISTEQQGLEKCAARREFLLLRRAYFPQGGVILLRDSPSTRPQSNVCQYVGRIRNSLQFLNSSKPTRCDHLTCPK